MTNWQPISEFKPEEFEGGQFFLVWMGASRNSWPEISQWLPDYVAEEGQEPQPVGEPTFQGTWRHAEGTEEFEPVAFARIDPCTLFDGEKHDSDCATNNAPALPVGGCDCALTAA